MTDSLVSAVPELRCWELGQQEGCVEVLLCSDGVWDCIDNPQMAFDVISKELRRSDGNSQQAAEFLMHAALAQPSCSDNVTVIFVTITG